MFYIVYYVFLYCYVYYFSFVFNCLFPIFVQVYRPLPPRGNPNALNKYYIICAKSDVYRIRTEYFNSFEFSSFMLQDIREGILVFHF
jgi:hypothetical protein